MLTRLRQLRRDERGLSFVYVGMGFMAFLSATTLAIDVGMFMTARTQAQNSADAGALAGATALALNSWTDRSATGPAVQGATNAALANQVIYANVSVSYAAGDITFPNDPNGIPDRVKVDVYRTSARSNPVPTLMGSLFGVQTADIVATATAEAAPAGSITCAMPFTIPDKWREVTNPDPTNQYGENWTPDSSFDLYDSKGNPLPNPDVYIPPGQDGATGYTSSDIGTEIVLKANNTLKVTASFYNPWDLPGSIGAADYRANIACNDPANSPPIPDNYQMPPENGNMTGPTAQGMQDLIDKDPNAQWDDTCKCVVNSNATGNNISPRIVEIPVYNPIDFANGAQHGKNITLNTVNFVAFFIEPLQNGNVRGRITRGLGKAAGGPPPGPGGPLVSVIRLVQ